MDNVIICSTVKKDGEYTQYPCNTLGAPNTKSDPLHEPWDRLEDAVMFCIEHSFDELHIVNLDTIYRISKFRIAINK